MHTDTGMLLAIADNSGENIGAAIAAQKIINFTEKSLADAIKAKELSDKISKITNVDQQKIDALHNELQVICSATEIINKERLLEISKNISQVEEFRKFTNNFTDLAKLQSNEILYLNLCDWLEPQAKAINARVKAMKLTITEIKDGISCVTDIHEFDIFHSLLGEMRPGSVADANSGGHWFLSELKAATFDVDKIEAFQKGYFDIFVKHIKGNSINFKPKTCFPVGSTVEDCINIVVDAIQNPKNKILSGTTPTGKQTFNLLNQHELKFRIYVEKGVVRFSPLSPHA